MAQTLKEIVYGLVDKAASDFKANWKFHTTAISQLYQQVWAAIYKKYEYEYNLVDLYIDGSETYAVCSNVGILYRIRYSYTDDGVVLQEPEKIEVQFVSKGSADTGVAQIMRQADGKYRYLIICATTVLNKLAEIDARSLFDAFVVRSKDNGRYPYNTFFHQGRVFKWGQCDFLAREENLLLASGTFDDTELGEIVREALERNPDYWGHSIGFFATEVEQLKIDEVEIPVYTDGYLDEITLCGKDHACAYFTSSVEPAEVSMDKRLKKDLKELIGDNPDLLAKYEALVDETNRTIADKELITRIDPPADEVPAAEAAPASVEEPAAEIPAEQTFELTEDALRAIAQATVGLPELTAFVSKLVEDAIAPANVVIESFKDTIAGMTSKIEGLQQTEKVKQQEWIDDLPRNQKLKVTYRARQGQVTTEETPVNEEESEAPMAEIANSTTSKFK